jgi:HPt (histidine-containing phosphotransfer) domain-containing protein
MAAQDAIDGAALDALLEMTGGDPAFLAEMIDTYVADARQLHITMRQSLAGSDGQALQRAAHSLKSNSATFGATTLARLCQELEERAKSGALDDAAELVARVEATYAEVETALRAARPVV